MASHPTLRSHALQTACTWQHSEESWYRTRSSTPASRRTCRCITRFCAYINKLAASMSVIVHRVRVDHIVSHALTAVAIAVSLLFMHQSFHRHDNTDQSRTLCAAYSGCERHSQLLSEPSGGWSQDAKWQHAAPTHPAIAGMVMCAQSASFFWHHT